MADAKMQEAELEKEKQQETELLKETPADEVRLSIIEKYGLDEDANSELIERLVESETESGKRLSTAIKQKISWREKAQKPAPTEQKKEETPQPVPKDDVKKLISDTLTEALEERDLSSLDFSDELKKELKNYAKVSGLTVKQAMTSDYFIYLKDKEDKAEKVANASIGGKRRSPSRQEYSAEKPPKPDMSTKEGREEWAEYRKFLKTQA